MNSNIFIPKKIKVGFQNRKDTYTQKLAYVIYYDEKGVLRKEKSWDSWRDKEIQSIDFDNFPISGLVLNKKVGGYSSGWNHRNTYVRVYDSRNFEFEIDVVNLLYILENTSSIKGKGLEGEFVYGFSGGNLILIPTSSPDYQEMIKYNEIVYDKNYIKAKDLIIGATYKQKNNREYIYIGRFDYWMTDTEYLYNGDWYNWNKLPNKYNNRKLSQRKIDKSEKRYWFLIKDINYFESYKTLGNKFINCSNSECVDNYAELFDKLERNSSYSPVDDSKDEIMDYTLEDFIEYFKNKSWGFYIQDGNKNKIQFRFVEDNKYKYCRDLNDQTITLEEIYNKHKPIYRQIYLKNGKLYKKEEV